jgi:hypothetical protein
MPYTDEYLLKSQPNERDENRTKRGSGQWQSRQRQSKIATKTVETVAQDFFCRCGAEDRAERACTRKCMCDEQGAINRRYEKKTVETVAQDFFVGAVQTIERGGRVHGRT